MLHLNPTITGMLGTVTLDQQACLFKLHPCMSVLHIPTIIASLLQGQQTYLPLHMFDYVALDQHTCPKRSNYVCNSFTCCSTNVLNAALNQQACLLQLHPTTWHVGYKHICSCVAEPASISQTCSYLYVPMLVPN